jgi:hypothetical protein
LFVVCHFLFLEKKESNQRKFKANPNAPRVLPGQRLPLRSYDFLCMLPLDSAIVQPITLSGLELLLLYT